MRDLFTGGRPRYLAMHLLLLRSSCLSQTMLVVTLVGERVVNCPQVFPKIPAPGGINPNFSDCARHALAVKPRKGDVSEPHFPLTLFLLNHFAVCAS